MSIPQANSSDTVHQQSPFFSATPSLHKCVLIYRIDKCKNWCLSKGRYRDMFDLVQ